MQRSFIGHFFLNFLSQMQIVLKFFIIIFIYRYIILRLNFLKISRIKHKFEFKCYKLINDDSTFELQENYESNNYLKISMTNFKAIYIWG